ncbi:receptor-like protein kinase HSL1 [Phragmites australis]|uniref:receptor-like protein kinase HSL1 n=1 Tax=Phragmites australis TaxID=29695 RepID=UPI002D7719A8|nr:receptor-like protein kinase HSL1 [Phragmites australis]
MATPRRACASACLLLLVLVLPCCLLRRAAAQSQPADEAQLLLQIKRAWGDPPVLAAWNASAAGAHCAWPYVGCDTAGRVTNLSLPSANVAGPFPDAVGRLSSLTYLSVYNNSISGAFPTSLYRCASLQYLDLSQNHLVGKLPADIGRGLGANLTTLVLSNNTFNGTIPASLSSLRNLQYLALDTNRFAGTIPSELGELTSLQTLWLGTNWFDAGELPASFKNLTNLVDLWVAQCNLVGDFPSFVWSLKKLQRLQFYMNNLTGDVVVDGFAAMSMTIIDVSMNKLTGVIPEVFGSLENLTTLCLFQNNFSGEIPASIGRLPSLTLLRLNINRLNGTLPPELGKHSKNLSYIEADDNELTGAIPEGLCDGGQFKSLTASRNRLNGSIPAGLANCSTLNDLQLDSNQLSGEVPVALWTATQLQYVLLRNNRLSGSLPATMYYRLYMLHIENNQFGGSVPAAAVALQVFTAGNNQFSGEIPASLGDGMPLLQTLDLSGNQISGGIPRSVAKLRQLTQMNMSRNRLTGEIPAELGAMPVLSVLDLSSNKLSGDIPPALVKPNLNSLNLSSNQLSGEVPAGLAIAAYDRSFLDNPSLCTAASGSGYLTGVRSCAAGSQAGAASSGGVSHALRTGLLAAGAALLLIAAAFAFFVVRDIKKRRRLAKQDDWKITPFQALDFGEAAIVRGLMEENLIGRGGSGRVYRVTYTNRRNGSAGAVAVKQIRTAGTVDEKLEREFESEASILGNVRHNNIVRLLCCLSGAESKLLVYDYMDNGSLDKWIHGDALGAGVGHPMARVRSVRRTPLDWPTRLRVAVGAAQGLCYMHHECTPPIVHRDVKTSNILLDSEFRAKVADFGLARMLVRAGAPETMSAIAGSFGYMAPECAYSKKVNEKVDVYSFGVVLLELTTGKEANSGGEHGCLAEWARHHYQSGGSISDATDKSIRYAGYSDEIEAVFRLGVMCTGDSPSSRPTMKDVLQILLKCSEQTHQKSKTEHAPVYEVAPLLPPQRGSRRKQLSNGTEIGMEENSDFDSIV